MADETTTTSDLSALATSQSAALITSSPSALSTTTAAALTTSQAAALTASTAPPATTTTATQLRALEDKHLGADAPRVNGAPETGHGSLFSRLPLVHQAHMLALKELMKVEDEVSAVKAELVAIEAKLKNAADTVIAAAKKAA